ncbi:MAG: cobalamin biosynthesis protein CobW [Clostridiales bacterium]|nr:cobalamin biosynthesis protein CobW [Clostridiales bacterium]
MSKIDIFSGFLGAGKTTLIKKLIKEAYSGERLVLIENEFGEIGVDGGFLQDAGIQVNELNSGCICCSLVGDFSKALQKVQQEYNPDRILIEPSGVGKLSDVIRAVNEANLKNATVNCTACVVDAKKCKMYMKNFGEFFNDQISSAACIVFSHTDACSPEKLQTAIELVRQKNATATIVTTPWNLLSGKDILGAMEQTDTLQAKMEELVNEHKHHEHHHEHGEECCCGHHHEHEHHHEHHHEHGEECCCGHHHEHEHEHHEHHHEHGEECCCGHHHDHEHHEHHHEHGEECCCGHHHEHHHEHGEECCCGHHHEHHDHHHHHADEVFTSWGVETSKQFTKDGVSQALIALNDSQRFGTILRAKGIVAGQSGEWIHFDFVPGEADVRLGVPAYTGRLCVIGSNINEEELKNLFGV